MTCQKLNNTIDKEKLKRQQFLIKYRTTTKAQKPGDENLFKNGGQSVIRHWGCQQGKVSVTQKGQD